MYTKQEVILRSHREGKSQRSISRELGISRKTVRKYLIAHDKLLGQKGSESEVLSESLSTEPHYKMNSLRVKRKISTEISAEIDRLEGK